MEQASFEDLWRTRHGNGWKVVGSLGSNNSVHGNTHVAPLDEYRQSTHEPIKQRQFWAAAILEIAINANFIKIVCKHIEKYWPLVVVVYSWAKSLASNDLDDIFD